MKYRMEIVFNAEATQIAAALRTLANGVNNNVRKDGKIPIGRHILLDGEGGIVGGATVKFKPVHIKAKRGPAMASHGRY